MKGSLRVYPESYLFLEMASAAVAVLLYAVIEGSWHVRRPHVVVAWDTFRV